MMRLDCSSLQFSLHYPSCTTTVHLGLKALSDGFAQMTAADCKYFRALEGANRVDLRLIFITERIGLIGIAEELIALISHVPIMTALRC